MAKTAEEEDQPDGIEDIEDIGDRSEGMKEREELEEALNRAKAAEDDRDKLAERVRRIEEVLDRLVDAAEVYAADQSGATDQRCGWVQPINADEGEELNAALRQVCATLEKEK